MRDSAATTEGREEDAAETGRTGDGGAPETAAVRAVEESSVVVPPAAESGGLRDERRDEEPAGATEAEPLPRDEAEQQAKQLVDAMRGEKASR